MSNFYIPSDIKTSPIVGDPERIDQLADRIKSQIRQNVILFLKEHLNLSALDLFSSGPPGLQACPNLSIETAEELLKIAISIIDFNGRRLCSKADAQRMSPLAEAYSKHFQFLWRKLQAGNLGVGLLNVGTVMYIRSLNPEVLPADRIARHAMVTQPGCVPAIREGDYDKPLVNYFVPYPIPEWHDLDHVVCAQIDDRFSSDLRTIQRIPNKITQLNSADPNYLIYLAPDDMTAFPMDSDYGMFQRLAPWFYRRDLLRGMNVDESVHDIKERLAGFLYRCQPAVDSRTGKRVVLPKFSHEFNAQKWAALVWGSWGEVASKEVSPYLTFLDKEEPGLTKGYLNSDPKLVNSAIRTLIAIAEHEESPPTSRRMLTELAYARASMESARFALDEAKNLHPELRNILTRLLNAFDFENPDVSGEHPSIALKLWADWYDQHDISGLN